MPEAPVIKGDGLYLDIQVRHGVLPHVYSPISYYSQSLCSLSLQRPSFRVAQLPPSPPPPLGVVRLIETSGEELELGARSPGFLPPLGTASYWTSIFLLLLELPLLLGGKESPQGG